MSSFVQNVVKICQIWKCYRHIFKQCIKNNLLHLPKASRDSLFLVWILTKYLYVSFLGLFSLAKQKIKNVQDNFKTATPNEPPKPLAQFFASNPNDTYSKIGYMRSYDDYFRCVRKTRLDQILTFTRQTLLRVELLTNTSEGIPRNGNSKERQSIKNRTFF